MKIEHFNRILEEYSHNITALRFKRIEIGNYPSEQLFQLIGDKDADQKGFLTKQEIVRLWFSEEDSKVECILRWISRIFVVEKISYSLIVKFLLRDTKSANITPRQESFELSQLIASMLKNQYKNSFLQATIDQNMHLYIPMKYQRPSRDQLSQYAINQQITIDIDEVTRALNLVESHIEQKSKRQLYFSDTLNETSVSNLQRIMQRMQERVNNFGKEWMIPQ